MATRTLTWTVLRLGSPWPDCTVGFDVSATTTTTSGTYPGTVVGITSTDHTVTATTDADGHLAVPLDVEVPIRVVIISAMITSGTSVRPPKGTIFEIVIPDGHGAIDMADIIAAEHTPVTPTLLGRVLPPGGDTGQALVKATDADYDAEWSDVEGGGGAAEWGGIGGTLADQTDLATALAGKADTGHTHTMADVTDLPSFGTAATADTGDFATATQGALADTAVQPGDLGSAAYTDSTAYATAAQGALADTAVQPEALADVATSGAYSDLTGTPAIPTLPATIVEAVVAGDNVTVDASDPAHPVVSASGGGGGLTLAGDGTAETAARSDHQHVTGIQDVTIGLGAAGGGNSVTLGHNASSTTGVVAIGRNANVQGVNSIGVGHSVTATGAIAVAVGNSTQATQLGTVAVGYDARATANRAIAIGASARSTVPDTAVIKANDLDVQRSNGTGETRLSLYSPNGTKYWLTVDDSGTLAATPA